MATQYSPKIVTDGLVLYLDAGNRRSYPESGTSWTNIVDGTNNGTLTNGPTFSDTNLGNVSFDGVNDYVSLGTFINMGTTNRTYFTWFKVNAVSTGFRRVITFPADDTATDTPTFTIGVRSTGHSIGIGNGSSGYVTGSNLSSIVTGVWVNVSATVISKTITVYVNTTFAGTATATGTVSTSPIGYIGRYNNNYSQFFNGQVASVMYYNRILSITEIVQNFNATRNRFGI